MSEQEMCVDPQVLEADQDAKLRASLLEAIPEKATALSTAGLKFLYESVSRHAATMDEPDEPDTKRVVGMLEAARKVLLEGWEHDGLSSQEAAAVHILVQRAIVDLGGELVANALPLAER